MQNMEIGDAVTFTDRVGRPRPALVTAVWQNDPAKEPSLNVVIVSDDGAKHDGYGRQIEHETSVPHRSAQNAHGYAWERSTE